MANFTKEDKAKVEEDIAIDFKMALEGILKLPMTSRKGVYLAYFYYLRLFKKIKRMPAAKVLEERVRIPNSQKIVLMFNSLVRHQLNCL
jgi:phytoene/squalene synthetase